MHFLRSPPAGHDNPWKNHIQKRPVDLLIIHYKDLRNHLFRLLLCVYLSLMINHVILGDGHVFLIFA